MDSRKTFRTIRKTHNHREYDGRHMPFCTLILLLLLCIIKKKYRQAHDDFTDNHSLFGSNRATRTPPGVPTHRDAYLGRKKNPHKKNKK